LEFNIHLTNLLLGIYLQRRLIIAFALIYVGAVLVAAYALLNTPFYGNILPPYDSSRNPVNIIFQFGTGRINELNTFHGTFTKDLIIDGTVTAKLILTTEELELIQQKILEADFFNVPETFPLKSPLTMPDYSYYLMVNNRTATKAVTWGTNSQIDSITEARLNQLADFIINIISEKPELKLLPPAKGAYL